MSNREIKFRVWSLKYKQWMNHCAIIDCNGNIFSSFIAKHDDGRIEHMLVPLSKENVIQQFTGLKDKNGNKIYEGDIVQYLGLDGDSETKPEIVNWNESWASFHIGDNCLSRSISKRYHIIGNIFENPELLK